MDSQKETAQGKRGGRDTIVGGLEKKKQKREGRTAGEMHGKPAKF